MKKITAVIIAAAVAALGILSLVACQPKITEVSMSVSTMDFGEVNEETFFDRDNKREKRVYQGTFGGKLSLDDVRIYCNYADGSNADVTDKCEVTGTLPQKLEVGEYTVTYNYGDYTGTLIVRVDKLVLGCPDIVTDDQGNFRQYVYNGTPQTAEFDADYAHCSLVDPQSVTQTDAGVYRIAFELNDKKNTAWHWLDENNNFISENFERDWIIQKQRIITDGSKLLTPEALETAEYDELNYIYTLRYAYDGTPKVCPLRAGAFNSAVAKLVYREGNLLDEGSTTPPTERGTYTVYLDINPSAKKNYRLSRSDFDGSYEPDYEAFAVIVIE